MTNKMFGQHPINSKKVIQYHSLKRAAIFTHFFRSTMVVKCLCRQAALLVWQLSDTSEIKMWIRGTLMSFTHWGKQKAINPWEPGIVCVKLMGTTPNNYSVNSLILKIPTWLSRPRSNSMIKKRTAQRIGSGIMDTALGYAMKAKPGPGRRTKWG